MSWQIVPNILPKLLKDKDADRSRAVMAAMLKMVKLDVKTLKEAYKESGGKSAKAGKSPKADKKATFEAAAREGIEGAATGAATTPKKKAAPKKKTSNKK